MFRRITDKECIMDKNKLPGDIVSWKQSLSRLADTAFLSNDRQSAEKIISALYHTYDQELKTYVKNKDTCQPIEYIPTKVQCFRL